MTNINPDHPSLEEVRRHWGLAVDIHRRDERLAAFDRLIQSLQAEAWEAGVAQFARYGDVDTNPYRKEGNE